MSGLAALMPLLGGMGGAGLAGALGGDALMSTLGAQAGMLGGDALTGGLGSAFGMGAGPASGPSGAGVAGDPLAMAQANVMGLIGQQLQQSMNPWRQSMMGLAPIGAELLRSQLYPEFGPVAPAHSSPAGMMGPLRYGPNGPAPSPIQSYLSLIGAL